MSETIYAAGDVQGYDFAFDAVGQFVDWQPVARAARSHSVRLSLSLAMLFTTDGNVRQKARASVTIPRGADETEVKRAVYARIRDYVKSVAVKLLREEAEEEGEEEIDTEAAVSTPNTVALLSEVTLQ